MKTFLAVTALALALGTVAPKPAEADYLCGPSPYDCHWTDENSEPI